MSGGLHELARQTGRGPDDRLVHMSSNELNALQGLAEVNGGSLTINPHTGLPEAGFLDKILPTVLGVGLSLIPGVGPLAAAGLVGAGYGVAKGSLGEGLMAGLGAYGGANLAGTLSTLGSGASQAAAQKLTQDTIAQNAVNAGANAGAAQAAGQAGAQSLLNPGQLQNFTPEMLGTISNQARGLAPNVYNAVQPTMGGIQQGLGALQGNWRDVPAAWQAYTGGGLKGMAALGGLAAPFMSTKPAKFDVPGEDDMPPYEGPYSPAQRNYQNDARPVTAENSGEWLYFDNVKDWGRAVPFKKYALGGQVSDGVSDSVPANINGAQPAALSEGEFVLPARVVAEIGNGSSDAGAQKLAQMLAKVETKMRGSRRGQPSGADMVAAQTMGVA